MHLLLQQSNMVDTELMVRKIISSTIEVSPPIECISSYSNPKWWTQSWWAGTPWWAWSSRRSAPTTWGPTSTRSESLFLQCFLLSRISTFSGGGGQRVLGHVHGHEQSVQQDRPRRLADRCRGHEEQTPWERYWSIFKQKFLTISFSAKEKEKQGYFLIIWLICTKLNSSATNLSSQADKGQSFFPESTQSSWALLNCDR